MATKRKVDAISNNNNKSHDVPHGSITTTARRNSAAYGSDQELSAVEGGVLGQMSEKGKGVDAVQVKRVRKMSAPAPAISDEYEEDRGRMESLQFMKSVKAVAGGRRGTSRRSTQFLREFEESVQKREIAALSTIDTRHAEITASTTQFQTDFRTIHAAILMDPIASTSSTQDRKKETVASSDGMADFAADHTSCTSHTSHALFPKCTAAFENLQAMLDEYEALNAKMTSRRHGKGDEHTERTLTPDLETLARLLDAGKVVAARKARRLLLGENSGKGEKEMALRTVHGSVPVRKDNDLTTRNTIPIGDDRGDDGEQMIDVESLFFGEGGIGAITAATAGPDGIQLDPARHSKAKEAGGDGRRGGNRYTDDVEDDDSESWAVVAAKQERAVKRLVGTLPAYKPTTRAEEWSD